MSMMNNDWDPLYQQEFSKPYMQDLFRFLQQEYATKTIYPPKEQVFSALRLTPLSKVKVVILGQDPYHGPNQAHGIAFSVNPDQPIPPSLKNIYKELESEYHTPILRSGDLRDWARQGVLLLNPIMSVQRGKPLSHQNKGWERFTNTLLEALNAQDRPIVFILWGNKARSLKKMLTNPEHLVLESAHPSPLSASRGFFGSNCFQKANAFLEAHHIQPIQWTKSNLKKEG